MNIAGICADRDPHRFVATEGLFELAENRPEKILNTIPSVCKILKSMAQMKNSEISYQGLRFLQELIVCHEKAPALIVKHLGVLLPLLTPTHEKRGLRLGGMLRMESQHSTMHIHSFKNTGSSNKGMYQETMELLNVYSDKDSRAKLHRFFPNVFSKMDI